MTSNKCPLCKIPGEEVQRVTVENLVKDYFRKHLKSLDYNICLNKNCSIAYYNNETNEIYFNRDLNISGFKDNDNPVICYCANVTFKDIIEEIVIKKTSDSLEDIIANTGSGRELSCKRKSPIGKSCRAQLEETVRYALDIRNNPK